jgi:membrane protease YdiL (CAAX protease family)
MSASAVAIPTTPAVAGPRLRGWLRLLAVLVIPLAAGGLAMLAAQLLGVTGRGRSVAFYGVQLVVAGALAQRVYGLRAVGLGRPPGPAAWAWAAALVGLRLVPWLALIPLTGWTRDLQLLLPALAYFLLFNAAAEELLFRGLLYQAILGLGASLLVAAAASSVVFALLHLNSAGLLFLPVFAADGLAFCALRVRARSLYAPIAAHAALNFTTAAVLVSSRVVSDATAVAYVVLVVAVDLGFYAACTRLGRRESAA